MPINAGMKLDGPQKPNPSQPMCLSPFRTHMMTFPVATDGDLCSMKARWAHSCYTPCRSITAAKWFAAVRCSGSAFVFRFFWKQDVDRAFCVCLKTEIPTPEVGDAWTQKKSEKKHQLGTAN